MRALARAPRIAGKPAEPVCLTEYPLQFCHSDIRCQNFFIHPDTLEVWLIDAEHINILPSPFASYALHAIPDSFIHVVAERINLERWPYLNVLIRAARLLQQSGNKSLGLDSNGEMLKRRRVKKRHANPEYQENVQTSASVVS
ncbi:hypothetical protein M413DRAFT_30238 [Hebeloma cylindrosporum]|uniref:Uncharacterized protein n=1 Tax=Hebeloma cylindrosporum TaxID=76867 RepID=A0A0C3C2A2_HEBCY|nr:hypothetical protein M413DRAFT_30238 [Hebeloma cylindrosporum h7]